MLVHHALDMMWKKIFKFQKVTKGRRWYFFLSLPRSNSSWWLCGWREMLRWMA
jgi:hypothetical protein